MKRIEETRPDGTILVWHVPESAEEAAEQTERLARVEEHKERARRCISRLTIDNLARFRQDGSRGRLFR